ncbi:penicillin-binding protein 2 [Verrucomicrobiota bacterium]
MALNSAVDRELMRVRVVAFLMLVAFVVLGYGVWRIQVRDAPKYKTRFVRQSLRMIRLPGPRGRILDRSGVCLADNRPSYCVAVYVEELRQPGRASNTVNRAEEVVDGISRHLGLPREVSRKDIENHVTRRRALELLAWRDIGEEMLAKWQESNIAMPGHEDYAAGVAVGVQPVRVYPQGKVASHILGFVGRAEPVINEEKENYHFHLPEVEGKYGVEKTANDCLLGTAGYNVIRVDASGFRHEEVDSKDRNRDPEPGLDMMLTIDTRIQRVAERTLEGEKGALVMLDPRNGDVLAIVSSPGFDPNAFSPAIPAAEWARLVSDGKKPLLNRAVSEVYAMGSTLKPVVALAALVNRAASGATTFSCSGAYVYGRLKVDCWSKAGHGKIAMRKAIEQSCNTYFCSLGATCGHEAIEHTSEALGLGRRTGIKWTGLVGEASGLVPTDRWKRRTHGDRWRIADTCHMSIGQGAINATPLQMAIVTAALANGGYVYRPRLVFDSKHGLAPRTLGPGGNIVKGDLVTKMPWSKAMLQVVRGGMMDVVEAERGTGKRAKIAGVKMAGKTGTAEVGPPDARKKDAWMLAFAPFEEPRYAVVIVVENALSGGRSAAPRIKILMEEVFKIEAESVTARAVGGDKEPGVGS